MGTMQQFWRRCTSDEHSRHRPDGKKLGWFVESSYGFGDHDQTVTEDAFDYDSVSVTTGTDYNFGSGVAGISFRLRPLHGGFRSTHCSVSGGDVEVSGISGSLFGGYFANGWTLSGIATAGSLESDAVPARRLRFRQCGLHELRHRAA